MLQLSPPWRDRVAIVSKRGQNNKALICSAFAMPGNGTRLNDPSRIANSRKTRCPEKEKIISTHLDRSVQLDWNKSTSLKQPVSDNGTRAARSPHRSFYLVHIPVRAASYALDQLEILLRVPPRQVDTGVHHVRCRSRHRARTTEKRQWYTKTGILRKNIRRQKIPAQIQ